MKAACISLTLCLMVFVLFSLQQKRESPVNFKELVSVEGKINGGKEKPSILVKVPSSKLVGEVRTTQEEWRYYHIDELVCVTGDYYPTLKLLENLKIAREERCR
jgi:hypothetical protein